MKSKDSKKTFFGSQLSKDVQARLHVIPFGTEQTQVSVLQREKVEENDFAEIDILTVTADGFATVWSETKPEKIL